MSPCTRRALRAMRSHTSARFKSASHSYRIRALAPSLLLYLGSEKIRSVRECEEGALQQHDKCSCSALCSLGLSCSTAPYSSSFVDCLRFLMSKSSTCEGRRRRQGPVTMRRHDLTHIEDQGGTARNDTALFQRWQHRWRSAS